MRFMLLRNPVRFLWCFLTVPLVLPFLFHARTKRMGFSALLWITTFCMSNNKLANLRRTFIKHYLTNSSTIVFKDAINQMQQHLLNADEVIVVSGASRWMVKAIFSQKDLPPVKLICSEEKRFLGGMICTFHCYAMNKAKRIQRHYELAEFNSLIGYSDSAADIPLLTLCHKRVVVNPQPKCLKRLRKSFNQQMKVVSWA